jgi:hypothetical protein
MLLHVIPTPLPVDLAVHRAIRQSGGKDVNYVVALVEDVQNRHTVQGAGIVGLSARGGVKRTSIQNDAQTVFCNRNGLRVERLQIRVVVVKAACEQTATLTHSTP